MSAENVQAQSGWVGLPEPAPGNEFLVDDVRILLESLRKVTGRELVRSDRDPVEAATFARWTPLD